MRARDRIALLFGGLAFGGVVLGATVTSDSAMEARLRRILADEVAAPCAFESCTFSFLEGFEVLGLTVLDPDDPLGEPLLRVGEARLDYNLGVLSGGPRVTDVHLWAPQLRLVRHDDGTFPLLRAARRSGSRQATGAVALPPVVVHGGTLVLGDPAVLAAGRTLALRSIDLRLSPGAAPGDLSVLGRAVGDAIGPVRVSAELSDAGRRASVQLDLEAARIGPELAERVGGQVADLVRGLAVSGTVVGQLSLEVESQRVVSIAGEATLSDAAALITLPETDPEHDPPERLALTGLGGSVELADGRLVLRSLDGRLAGAAIHVEATLDVPLPGSGDADAPPPRALELSARVAGLHLDDGLARALPWSVRRVQEAYALQGTVDADVTVAGPLEGPTVVVEAAVRDANGSYLGYSDAPDGVRRGFPYRVTDLAGSLRVEDSHVRFDARGRHGTTPIHVAGFADSREVRDLFTDVTVTATDVAIDDDIRAAFGDRADVTLGPWQPGGTAAQVTVHVTRVASIDGERTALDIDIGLDGRATLHPALLPTPLDGVSGRVRIEEPIVDGRRVPTVVLDDLRARGDGFALAASGEIVGADDEAVEDLLIAADVQALDGPIRDALTRSSRAPERLAETLARFDPRGPAGLRLRLRGGGDRRADVLEIELRGASVRGGDDVPLRLSEVAGTLTLSGDAISTDRVTGLLLGAPFEAGGRVEDLSAVEPRITLDARGADVPIGGVLRDDLGRLVADVRGLWDDLGVGANARADVELSLRPPGAAAQPFTLGLARLRGDVTPLGLPTSVKDGTVAFDGREVLATFEGTLGRGDVSVRKARYDVQTGRLWADLSARALDAPECIAAVLSPKLMTALTNALPGRFVHVPAAEITWDPAVSTLAIVGDLEIRPRERAAHGGAGLRAEGALTFERLEIRVPATGSATIDGTAVAEDVTFHPGLDVGSLAGRLAFRGSLDRDVTRVAVEVADASLLAAGFPLSGASFTMDVEGARVRIRDLAATVYGGALTGSFTSGLEQVAYRGRIEVKGVDLREILPDLEDQTSEGLIDGIVELRNVSGAPDDLVGSGSVRLRDGKILRVPVLTTVLNAIDTALLGAGVRGHFREGGMIFDVRGSEIEIDNLHLSGPEMPDPLPGSLGLRNGRGRFNVTDQRIDLVLEPRIGLGVLTLDPTGLVTGILNTVQWFLLREMRIEGTLRNPKASWQVVPSGAADAMRPRPQPAGELRRFREFPW